MKKIVFLFPGQGSQHVGMGSHLVEKHPGAGDLFRQADAIVEFPLSEFCFRGPDEELRNTEVTQPALYTTSAAALAVLRSEGIEPAAVAGHSLGEYSALHAAGSLDFETGLRLVATRGRAFAAAGKDNPGAMAAIVGLPIEKVKEVASAVTAKSGGTVLPANQNEPMQTVISGDPAAVEEACERMKKAGAKRAILLPVSGAFHSPLVASAAAIMRDALAETELAAPRVLFVNNVDAQPIADPSAIKGSLVRQVTGSVRWVETIELLLQRGHDTFVEVGSGKALAGLLRRINRDATCYTTESEDSLARTIEALRASQATQRREQQS